MTVEEPKSGVVYNVVKKKRKQDRPTRSIKKNENCFRIVLDFCKKAGLVNERNSLGREFDMEEKEEENGKGATDNNNNNNSDFEDYDPNSNNSNLFFIIYFYYFVILFIYLFVFFLKKSELFCYFYSIFYCIKHFL